MIKVLLDPNSNIMAMVGHAGAAPKGQDTICAAASMLMFTLATVVSELKSSGKIDDGVVQMEPGWAFVACRAVPGQEVPVRAPFDMARIGAALLAKQYPKYVECLSVDDYSEYMKAVRRLQPKEWNNSYVNMQGETKLFGPFVPKSARAGIEKSGTPVVS